MYLHKTKIKKGSEMNNIFGEVELLLILNIDSLRLINNWNSSNKGRSITQKKKKI